METWHEQVECCCDCGCDTGFLFTIWEGIVFDDLFFKCAPCGVNHLNTPFNVDKVDYQIGRSDFFTTLLLESE